MDSCVSIDRYTIGKGHSTYIVAEMSANHNQSFDQAIRILHAARDAGANAVKLQTYTPDTITLSCETAEFQIKGTIWNGKNLHQLYGEAYTPWDWQPKLKQVADEIGLTLFSTPFDDSSVEFLERMEVPAYKIASFELVDTGLLRNVARTGKPVIMSTGMATLAEIDEAVVTLREAGCEQLILLKCTSTYPADPTEMNLRTIPHMAEAFGVPVGLSDHTLGIAVPLTAVTLGACIVEKHFTLSRSIPGPDSAFSLEPHEFKAMVDAIRTAEKALGKVSYTVGEHEAASRVYRRSLFVTKDMVAGDLFTEENIRSIRPGYGLHTRYKEDVIGRKASQHIPRGTPLHWGLICE